MAGPPDDLIGGDRSGVTAITPGLIAQLALGVFAGGAMAYAAYVLTAPAIDVPPLFPFQDKVYHAACFGVLTGPGVLVLPRRYLWFWLVYMAFFGIGIEIVQWRWIPTRSGSAFDFMADVIGIALSTLVALAIRKLALGRFGGRDAGRM